MAADKKPLSSNSFFPPADLRRTEAAYPSKAAAEVIVELGLLARQNVQQQGGSERNAESYFFRTSRV